MLENILITRCRSEESQALLDLWTKAGVTSSPTDSVEDVRLVIQHPASNVLVAKSQENIVGCVIGTFDGWRGNISRLAVLPEYRRYGIARALVADVEEWLIGQGAKVVNALVEKDHPWATGFWEFVEYEEDSRMARYFKSF